MILVSYFVLSRKQNKGSAQGIVTAAYVTSATTWDLQLVILGYTAYVLEAQPQLPMLEYLIAFLSIMADGGLRWLHER